jgi:hypothetical protein
MARSIRVREREREKRQQKLHRKCNFLSFHPVESFVASKEMRAASEQWKNLCKEQRSRLVFHFWTATFYVSSPFDLLLFVKWSALVDDPLECSILFHHFIFCIWLITIQVWMLFSLFHVANFYRNCSWICHSPNANYRFTCDMEYSNYIRSQRAHLNDHNFYFCIFFSATFRINYRQQKPSWGFVIVVFELKS